MKKFKGIKNITKEETAKELGSLIWNLEYKDRIAAWSFFDFVVIPEEVEEYGEKDLQKYILNFINGALGIPKEKG
jgi:hypothetical protein